MENVPDNQIAVIGPAAEKEVKKLFQGSNPQNVPLSSIRVAVVKAAFESWK